MRALITVLCILPFFAQGQINRSARELACETTKDYVVNKLFKGREYEPVTYGQLKAWNDNKSRISWTLQHSFEVEEPPSDFDKRPKTRSRYNFLFYLDKQMKVIKAESVFMVGG